MEVPAISAIAARSAEKRTSFALRSPSLCSDLRDRVAEDLFEIDLEIGGLGAGVPFGVRRGNVEIRD